MNDDFTESYGFLSPDVHVKRVPRVPDSVERTQNLLGIAEALDASSGERHSKQPGVAAAGVRSNRKHQGVLTPKTQTISSAGFTVPDTRSMDFAPEILSHSTPVLGNIGNRLNMLHAPDVKAPVGRKTVVGSGSPSSEAGEVFRRRTLPTRVAQPKDLQQILDKVPLQLKQGFMDQIGQTANEIARDFASRKAFDIALDLDLTQDHTFDHQEVHADSAGTTPPSSRGNGGERTSSIKESYEVPHALPVEPLQARALMQDNLGSNSKPIDRASSPLSFKGNSSSESKSDCNVDVNCAELRKRVLEQERKISALEAQVKQLSLSQSALQREVDVLKTKTPSEEPVSSKFPESPSEGGRICSTDPITEDTLDEKGKKLYRRLQLHNIDEISDVEVRNILKCMMFSLMHSDFEHLPEKTQQLAIFLRELCKFMDAIHHQLYGCLDMQPLDYMYKSGCHVDDRFQECLAGMTSLIRDKLKCKHR